MIAPTHIILKERLIFRLNKIQLFIAFRNAFAILLILSLTQCKDDSEEVIPAPEQYLYSFFVAGHTYGKNGVNNIGFHPPFKNKLEFLRDDETIEFGVLTGDLVISGTDTNWNEVDADLAILEKPVFIAPGNHDVGNRALFESRYGASYQSFVYRSDLYIILDPNLDFWRISGDQLTFLQNIVQDKHDEVDNIFVFFHQVLWWTSTNIYKDFRFNSGWGRAKKINFWNDIEPLFDSIPNQVYMFAGDVGAHGNSDPYMYHKYDNITFIASGMGHERKDNIVIVDIREDKSIRFRLIALNGNDPNSLGRLEDYEL